jgi:hypothetical protein
MARWKYSFGNLEWGGGTYAEDVLILPDGKVVYWPREHKHHLKFSYLADVVETKPRLLIIGTGHDGVMEVPDKVLDKLAEKGIDAEPMPTEQALKRLEKLLKDEKKVAAALHLTC